MKRTVSTIIVLTLLFSFSSCSKDKSYNFNNANEAYEAMTNAAENGDYKKAVECYENGAADSGDSNLTNWYYYSLAMNLLENNGCLGCSYNLLTDRCSDLFTKANEAANNILLQTRNFDGIYQYGRYYLYIVNGKIAVGTDEQLSGIVFCNYELVVKNKEYYWAEHNTQGDDNLLYKLELSENGISVTSVNEENIYGGNYTCFSGEMPELVY